MKNFLFYGEEFFRKYFGVIFLKMSCFVLLFFPSCLAQPTIVLSNEDKKIELGNKCLIYKDLESKFKAQDLLDIPFEQTSKPPSFGYSAAPAWVKINVQNISNKSWVLELDNPSIDEVDFFLVQNEIIIQQYSIGDLRPPENYPIKNPSPIFDLQLVQNQQYTIYIRGKSTEDLNFQLTFYDTHTLIEHIAKKNLFWGIFFGFIILISLYNFFLWVTIKDNSYLYYILYVICFGLFQFSLYGFGYQYFWGNSVFNEKAHIVFVGGSVTFLAIFTVKFLDIFKVFPDAKRFFTILLIIWIFLLLIMVFTFSHKSVVFLMSMSVFGLFFQYYFSIKLLRSGSRTIRFYLLAIIAQTIAVIIILLKSFINIPGDFYLKLGSMVEMILFSVALGDKYREIEKDRIRQQKIRDDIASNLHDDLAASLSSLTMFSELNKMKIKKQDADNQMFMIFENISSRSREMMKQVREAVWEINPKNDESEEWLDRMLTFATQMTDSKNIELSLEIDPKIGKTLLPIDTRRHLYLFFKEAINNAVKYSEAQKITLSLQRKGQQIILCVKDHGIGFDVKFVEKGNGILNFKKHAKEIGGRLNIVSEIGKGTEIYLNFEL